MSSKAPRFKRTLGRQVSRIDPFAGIGESVLARELEGFNARRQAELDERARQESFLSGQQAGEEGAEADASERTIRGRAFNRGVLVSHQAALQTDIRDNVERFELEHESDPEGFDAKVEGLLDGLIAEADPRLQPFIKQRAADYAGRSKSRILARTQAKLETEAANDLQRGVEGLFDDATTASFEGDPLLPEARRQELDALLTDGVAGGLIEEGAATELRENFERQVTSHEVIGNFDRLVREQGVDAGADAIGRWQDVKPSQVGLTVEDHDAVTRQMVALRNREGALRADETSKNTAAARAEHNLRTDRVNDAITVMRDGFSPDQEQAKQVSEDLAFLTTAGDADDIQRAQALAEDFDIANAIVGQVHRFRRLPAAQRSDDLIELERALRGNRGASAEEVQLLKALQKTDADVTRELDTDPRGYLQREGLVEDPALNFESAQALVESLAGRDSEVGRALAGQPVPLLTAAEADQLSQVYEQAEIEERVALLGVITAGAGEDAEATLQQLDTKGHEQMALMGSFVMEGRGLLAREVMRGQLILASTPVVKPTADSGVRADIDDTWGGAMADWPEQRATFLDAAFAKYAELKGRTGDLSEIYENKLMQQALNAVLPTARYNGRRVAIPAGITADRFDAWTDSWDVETFTQFSDDDDGTPMAVPGVTAEQMLDVVRDDGRLIELGNGRYGVAVVSAASGLDRFLVKADGTPLMLEFPRQVE